MMQNLTVREGTVTPEEAWPECQGFDVGSPTLAREIARRWNLFADLVKACQVAHDDWDLQEGSAAKITLETVLKQVNASNPSSCTKELESQPDGTGYSI